MTTAMQARFDVQDLEALSTQLHLEWRDLAAILGVDQSTLWRWRRGESRPRPLAQSRLTQLGELRELLRRLFAGPDLARAWLHEAHPEMLGGSATPFAVLRSGRIDRVLTLLHFLARGA